MLSKYMESQRSQIKVLHTFIDIKMENKQSQTMLEISIPGKGEREVGTRKTLRKFGDTLR